VTSHADARPELAGKSSPGMLDRASPWRFSLRSTALRLFLTCWLVYALHFATNTVREIYPALSLGDHLSFDVSEYVGLHPDIFEIPGRGAFINNNPGTSMMGAVPYVLTKPVIDRIVSYVQRSRSLSPDQDREYDTIYPNGREFYQEARARGLDVKFALAAGVMQALLMAPLSAFAAVVMFLILERLTSSRRAALFLALLYAFATPIFYRTAQLNQNVLQAHFALFAFVLLWRPWDTPQHPRRPNYLLAGLLCGWTLVLDYSGLVIVLMLGGYAVVRRRTLPVAAKAGSDLVRFGTGVLVCVALLAGYQWLAFGHPLYPAQHYMPATSLSVYGYNGIDWPQLDLLWENAFGLRYGLFTSAPLLLLALWVPGWLRQRSRLVGRLETWFILAFTMAFFLFTAANQFSRLQFNSGVRHVVPVTPFLFLLAATVLYRLSAVWVVPIGIAATYWSWCLVLYRDVEQGWGVFESLIQVTLHGPRLPWSTVLERLGYIPDGRLITIPLLALAGAIVGALWAVRSKSRTIEYAEGSNAV
jgi:hypothetical protein